MSNSKQEAISAQDSPGSIPLSSAEVAAQVLAAAQTRQMRLAVAESLTGGMLCSTVASVPGASAVLQGSVTAYATDIKAKVLGVNEADLLRTGPIDGKVARQMAVGVAALLDADIGLATTGVAGPSGQDGHPVGEVFVAVHALNRQKVRHMFLTGSREEIRKETVFQALELAWEALQQE